MNWIFESSCWIKLLNSTWVVEFNFSTRFDTFSKKFQLNLILFKSSTWFKLKYLTWRNQSTCDDIKLRTSFINFINNVNILIYEKFMKYNCRFFILFYFFFKFYMLMQSKTMKHDAIYLNSNIEALCIY